MQVHLVIWSYIPELVMLENMSIFVALVLNNQVIKNLCCFENNLDTLKLAEEKTVGFIQGFELSVVDLEFAGFG